METALSFLLFVAVVVGGYYYFRKRKESEGGGTGPGKYQKPPRHDSK